MTSGSKQISSSLTPASGPLIRGLLLPAVPVFVLDRLLGIGLGLGAGGLIESPSPHSPLLPSPPSRRVLLVVEGVDVGLDVPLPFRGLSGVAASSWEDGQVLERGCLPL